MENLTAQKPIGVFDSGIGGLTVVKQMIKAMPYEDIIYFGDTARVPYGSKSNDTVINYAIQNTRFLLTKSVKAIVVACNTVSSAAMPILREMFSVPIIGMIEPGTSMALASTRNNRIGVIGTRGTINNRAYSQAILRNTDSVSVFEESCPLFVPLAEEGWLDKKATKSIAEEYLRELKLKKIDTLILGCTHYPMLRDVIQEVMGNKVTLIDSGIAASVVAAGEIKRAGIQNKKKQTGKQEYYVSDIPSTFKNVAELFLGNPIEHVQKVDIDYLQTKMHDHDSFEEILKGL